MDTVGAGDAFCAGVLGWLADEAITSRERVLALWRGTRLRSALSFALRICARFATGNLFIPSVLDY